MKDYEVKRISCKVAKEYIIKNHYSHGCHNGPSPCYGLFENDDFDTTLKMLDPELIGYENREEVKVRVERMYAKEDVNKHGVCALFIEIPPITKTLKIKNKTR